MPRLVATVNNASLNLTAEGVGPVAFFNEFLGFLLPG